MLQLFVYSTGAVIFPDHPVYLPFLPFALMSFTIAFAGTPIFLDIKLLDYQRESNCLSKSGFSLHFQA
ncbi:unnamed protein product [Brassica oleracea var. botrytis]